MITPRAGPVVPEVYWTRATSPGSLGAKSPGDAPSPGTDSVSRQVNSGSSKSRAPDSPEPSSAELDKSQRASASAAKRRTSSMPRLRLGTLTGTATTPAYRQPRNALRNARPGG